MARARDYETAEEEDARTPSEFIEAQVPENINPLTIPNERDEYLFTKWLMERPVHIYRGYQYEAHASYREDNNSKHPPEIMYWHEGLNFGNSEWEEWVEGQPGFEPIATFRKMGRPKLGGDNDDENSGDDDDDAPGEAAKEDEDANDAEGESAPATEESTSSTDGPRGVKRPRESSDLADLLVPRDDDDAMADAPGTSS
ncbi:hypothetical protein H072_4592 [Dactylellina haptotyla CBS 200.50]|uniref:Uncharacterized protein n=1 Tax=Dactylellina haptotyla (strain CBS 200.50) TaxID=1284197 RepID=S8C1J2_DACHA|nr:hypothetical protein H072_4592 [Dactylellina haptotyla CBS 200.50]